ncbi:MAG: hypothetical protein AB7D05_02735 [Mangrovibacterium sp.]
MKLEKVLNILMVVLVAVSAVLIVSLISNISDNEADAVMNGWLNTNLSWAYILLFATGGIAIIASLIHTASNKAAARKGLVVFLAAVVVLVISYSLASDQLPQFFGVEKFVADGTLTTTVSKWIDTTLIATYILAGLTVGATIFWSVKRIVKK